MRFLSIRPVRPSAASVSFVAFVCSLAVAACASDDAPPRREPLKLDVLVHASSTVNPDDQKRAAPILVRVYELRSVDAFNEADFYSLQEKDKTVLGDDLIARDQFLLRPGESKRITRPANGAGVALGFIAAYRDLPRAVWRAVWPMPPTPEAAWYRRAPKLKLDVEVDSDAVRIDTPLSETK
jgi:type VI secretion system protein VasD